MCKLTPVRIPPHNCNPKKKNSLMYLDTFTRVYRVFVDLSHYASIIEFVPLISPNFFEFFVDENFRFCEILDAFVCRRLRVHSNCVEE